MFRIHHEGYSLLIISLLLLIGLNLAVWRYFPQFFWFFLVICAIFYGILLQFFRNPDRSVAQTDPMAVLAPADGRICVIEEVEEPEYFQGKRLQVSIFMSPFNVHVNRNPVSGLVKYFKYHPGKYLVAWHPKSSTENERTTVVYETNGKEILMRQIAGALAKRIKWYIQEGDTVKQGDDMGFIKFGSRVDLFLPVGTPVNVKMDEQVKGNRTVIARFE